MINRILFLALFLVSLKSYGQDPKEILKKSYSKCIAITNGYYDMKMETKFMSDKDTVPYGEYKFYFKKLKKDSLYYIAFNSELLDDGGYINNTLYTGNEYVTFSRKDSTAELMSKTKWLGTLMARRREDISTFFQPFIFPLPNPNNFADKSISFKFIANETLSNTICYHIQMIQYPKYDSTEILHNVETKYEFWINKKDMIPIKYSVSQKILQYGDTLIQYDGYTLRKYHFNDPKNLLPLKLSAIPSYCKLKDYVPSKIKEIELLKDTIAPAFTLTSLQSKSVSLSDYKGQLILLDFFFKDCYPCMKAIPILQSLHEKYKSKGLNVIGIDPLDDESSGINHFVTKAGITYPVLLDKKDVNKAYHISSYPTLYLIDKKGNVIYNDNGFSEDLEKELEKKIKDNL